MSTPLNKDRWITMNEIDEADCKRRVTDISGLIRIYPSVEQQNEWREKYKEVYAWVKPK